MKQHAAGEHSGQPDGHYLMLRSLTDKYDPIFNFFFSKPISDICEGILTPQEMAMKELNLWDNDDEFLKRYYQPDEVPERIQLLAEIHHPKRLWTLQVPTLKSRKARKHVLKRIKRFKKLERKLQDIEEQEHRSFETPFLQDSDSDAAAQEESHTTFDSQVYDIYQEFEDTVGKDIVVSMGGAGILCDPEEEHWGEVEGPHHLTLDFDDLDRPHILKEYNRMKFKDGIKDIDLPYQQSTIPITQKPPFRNHQPPSKYIQSKREDGRSRSKLQKVTSHDNFARYERDASHTPENLRKAYLQNDTTEHQKKMKLKLKLMTARDENENNPGYLSPRLNQLSKYSKRIMLTRKPEQNSIEDQDQREPEKERVWSPAVRFLKEQQSLERPMGYNSILMQQTNKPPLHQQRYRTLYEQVPGSQPTIIPQIHSNIRMQAQTAHSRDWFQSSRQPRDFQRIRKKAIELIREQRNYPSPNDRKYK